MKISFKNKSTSKTLSHKKNWGEPLPIISHTKKQNEIEEQIQGILQVEEKLLQLEKQKYTT